MGGFLQSVLFGYTGLRLREAGLTFSAPPAMPNNATSLVVHSLAYQGFQLRFERTADMIRFDVLDTSRSGGTLLVGCCLAERAWSESFLPVFFFVSSLPCSRSVCRAGQH